VKLVILDRDGVINETTEDGLVRGVSDFVPIEGSLDAIASLCQHGYRVIVITNQSGIAHGQITIDEVNEIHEHMQS